MVSKVFEKLVNNRIVDHLDKWDLYSNFQCGFRSSQSTADLLTVVPERIARVFNRPGATWAVTLDIFKAFDRVWHAGLLYKLKSSGISSEIFLTLLFLFSIIDFKWFWFYIQKNFLLILEFHKAPFLNLHFSYYTLMTFLMLYILLYADDTTLCSRCDQASDLKQQLELTSELKSDLQDTVDWGKKWLVDFNTEKTQLVSLTGLTTLLWLMWKWKGFFLRKSLL